MFEQVDITAELRAIKAEAMHRTGYTGAAELMCRVRALRPLQAARAVAARAEAQRMTEALVPQSLEECAWWKAQAEAEGDEEDDSTDEAEFLQSLKAVEPIPETLAVAA